MHENKQASSYSELHPHPSIYLWKICQEESSQRRIIRKLAETLFYISTSNQTIIYERKFKHLKFEITNKSLLQYKRCFVDKCLLYMSFSSTWRRKRKEEKNKANYIASEYIFKTWTLSAGKIICIEHKNLQLSPRMYVTALSVASLDIVATLQAFPFLSSASLLLHL